jgi:undecaprenyl-diphosphatase
VIQAGAMLAVIAIYWQRLAALVLGLRVREQRDYAFKLAAAFLITAVLGLIVKKLGFELPTAITPVAWALIIGGVWILIAEWLAAKRPDHAQVTWLAAIAVGVGQIIAAIFPGTSRSAATIFAAMLTGTSNRAAATEFAFLVGIPTMFAASGYELLKQLRGGAVREDWSNLGIAFAVSTLTAFIAVKWLLRYIRTHRFTAFAIYRIALGGTLLLLFRSLG